jgi:hypothetical protein
MSILQDKIDTLRQEVDQLLPKMKPIKMKVLMELTEIEVNTILSAVSRDLGNPSNSSERKKRLDEVWNKIYNESRKQIEL